MPVLRRATSFVQYNATLEDKVNLLPTVLYCLSRDIYSRINEILQANCCEHFSRKTLFGKWNVIETTSCELSVNKVIL